MMQAQSNFRGASTSPRPGEHGRVRTVVLFLIFFCLGLAVSTVWFHRTSSRTGPAVPELSSGTKLILEHLDKPIEVRFYSMLDPGAATSLREFAIRDAQLLQAYQQAANGKMSVVVLTNADPNTALADGITGFDLDKGQGCFLGVALSCAGKKEVLAQLSPAWENALEADVSRAIQRLVEKATRPAVTAVAVPGDSAAIEEVRRKIPDLSSVSMQDAIRILREDSVKEFASTVSNMNEQVQAAQAELLKAQKAGSAVEQETAMKRLQAIQSEQAQKLKQIAADSQARIDALKTLKGEPR